MKKKQSFSIVAFIAALLIIPITASRASAQTELPYVENGFLYHSSSDSQASKQQVASGVLKILHYRPDANALLYLATPRGKNTDADLGSELVFVDTNTWATQSLASDVITANLSPDGTKIVAWNKSHEIQLLTPDGALIQKIGAHGAAPIFSDDGKLVAYEKLADTPQDGNPQSLFEFAKGIAVYNLQTGHEQLVTNGGQDDFAPVGFSNNTRELYFNSTRPTNDRRGHVVALWVVDLLTGQTRQLTNTGNAATGERVPAISENALWASDHTLIISSNGQKEGVWLFSFSKNGGFLSAKHIADGSSPRWQVPDKSIVFRTADDRWEKLDLGQ